MRASIIHSMLRPFGEPELFCGKLPSLVWHRWGHGGLARGEGLHLFVDDYRFEVCWRQPGAGLLRAAAAGVVTAPDFSFPADAPGRVLEWQLWRSSVVGALWASEGVSVVPVAMWGPGGLVPSRHWVSRGSWLAVRGPQRRQRWEDYESGFTWWVRQIDPAGVLFVGAVPGCLLALCKGFDVFQVGTHGGRVQRCFQGKGR